MSTSLNYRFTDFPPHTTHQGTGLIKYSPILAQPWTVAQDVSKPLGFQTKECAVNVLSLTIDAPHGPNWFGVAFRVGTTSFSSVNIFCHPHPGHAGMQDKDYATRTGDWPALFRYSQNLGFQLSAGDVNQVLVIPFFNNASYFTGGVFVHRWKEILSVIVNGASIVATLGDPRVAPKVELGVLEAALLSGKPLSVSVDNVIFSCFSFGRNLMQTLRFNMAGVGSLLREIWDFDGAGAALPQGNKIRTILYDQAVSKSPWSFHVPNPRWSGFPCPKVTDAHGFIPNTLLWHATTVSGVGH